MENIQHRTATLQRGKLNEAERSIPAILSTESPVTRYGETEILDHSKGAVDLSRATPNLPLLWSHDQTDFIGAVEDVRLDGKKLVGVLRFARNTKADEVFSAVKDKLLRGISIGYLINDSTPIDDGYRATAWQLLEASVTPVQADTGAAIQRGNTMENETSTDEKVVPHARWLKLEKKRREQIRGIYGLHENRGDDYVQLMNRALDDPQMSVDRASKLPLDKLGEDSPGPLASDAIDMKTGVSPAFGGYGNYLARDGLAEFTTAAVDGLLQRGGINVDKPHPGAQDCRNMRMSDIAETMLRQFGTRTSGMSRDQIIRKALSTRGFTGHTSSDFPNLLENVSEKALLKGFTETPAIWRSITRAGDLPDFKKASRVALSDFEDLEEVKEHGEFKAGSFSDLKENLQLATFGKLFNISRQALVNDDLNAFIGIPQGLAAAASRLIDDKVVAVITGNPVMNQDSITLFHASHGNLAGTPAALSVTELDKAFVAMASQQGPQGAILDVVPQLLIVPSSLDATARTLTVALNDPAGATLAEPNPFQGRLQVVSSARFDSDSTTAWYLSANPMNFDTLECAYLDGQQAPFLETRNGWTIDGTEFKVRLDFGVGPMDYRGLFKNAGA